jgi:hypothetical protein
MSQSGIAGSKTGGGGGNGIMTINGDTGSITGPTVTIYAHNSANQSGATVQFVNSGTISTLKLSDAVGGLCLGQHAGNDLGPGFTGQDCTYIGVGSGNSSLGPASYSNTGLGFGSLNTLTSGNSNTALGNSSLGQIVTGSYNTCIGSFSGTNYVGAESNNILIGNLGVASESNVMRLGSQGAGINQVTQTYIAGVINTVSGRVVQITTPGAYPYTTLITDYVILVDTTSARTINLVSSPVTGTTYRIKDSTGNAAAQNITITPASGNIDGAATFVMNANYQAVDLVYSGSEWKKF